MIVFASQAMLLRWDEIELNMVLECLFLWWAYFVWLNWHFYYMYSRESWGDCYFWLWYFGCLLSTSAIFYSHRITPVITCLDKYYAMLSVICGDFNVHKSSWLHSSQYSSAGRFCESHNLDQLVGFSTHHVSFFLI